MDDSTANQNQPRTVVDTWLEPLADAPCGPDLEYDNAFIELEQTAAGKPETQFAAAEPPNWRAVREASEALMGRTRDLRVAMHWLRAMLYADGLAAFSEGLRLADGLLQQYWADLHPKPDPDDGDAYARLNVLALLGVPEGVIGDLRQAVVLKARGVGELRVRDFEIAADKLPPKEGETPMSRAQLEQLLADSGDAVGALRTACERATEQLRKLSNFLIAQVGGERAPDVKPLLGMIHCVSQMLPQQAADAAAEDAGGEGAAAGGGGTSGPGLSGQIRTREEALRAIDMICAYLERTEPTNPAQLFLRRARKLINQNFLQLVRELAPEALAEVARIMGVDPETVNTEGG